MYFYASSQKKVVQRNIATAQGLRTNAINVHNHGATPAQIANGATGAVSNNCFTLTPQIHSQVRMQAAQAQAPGKAYAHPVPGGGQAGNHAERKLIFHDAGHTELGVSRTICNGCLNAIVAHAATAHVSDPNGTYQVVHAPTIASAMLNGVAPHRIQLGVGLQHVAN